MSAAPSPDRLEIAAYWYVLAMLAYIVLALLAKSVFLNWIVGPLFLVTVLELIPRAVRSLRSRGAR